METLLASLDTLHTILLGFGFTCILLMTIALFEASRK